MSGIETVVLDGSGTIIDDIHTVWKANSEAYKTNGFKRLETLVKFKEVFRLPISDFHRANNIPESMFDDIEKSYRQFYPNYSHHIRIFPEVKNVLEKLREEKITVGIASNIPTLFLKEHLQRFEILEFFDAVTGQDDCDEQKPSPKPISITLNKLKVKPVTAAYVGDMKEDIIAGKKANVYTIAICREGSYHPAWKLKKLKPDYFISDLNELLKIVKNK